MAEQHSYLKTHQLSGTGLIVDILGGAADLLEKARASTSGRAAKTPVKNGALRITLIAMRKGAAAKNHSVEGPATLQVMRGKLQIITPRGAEDIASGKMFALGAGVHHSHTALADCVALLTIAEPQH